MARLAHRPPKWGCWNARRRRRSSLHGASLAKDVRRKKYDISAAFHVHDPQHVCYPSYRFGLRQLHANATALLPNVATCVSGVITFSAAEQVCSLPCYPSDACGRCNSTLTGSASPTRQVDWTTAALVAVSAVVTTRFGAKAVRIAVPPAPWLFARGCWAQLPGGLERQSKDSPVLSNAGAQAYGAHAEATFRRRHVHARCGLSRRSLHFNHAGRNGRQQLPFWTPLFLLIAVHSSRRPRHRGQALAAGVPRRATGRRGRRSRRRHCGWCRRHKRAEGGGGSSSSQGLRPDACPDRRGACHPAAPLAAPLCCATLLH